MVSFPTPIENKSCPVRTFVEYAYGKVHGQRGVRRDLAGVVHLQLFDLAVQLVNAPYLQLRLL
jgi:hypothetical protein